MLNTAADFDGPEYIRKYDHERLGTQLTRVFDLMKDGHWRTLSEISKGTGDPQASISAQLRHLRKPKFGGHEVIKRARGERIKGLFEYRLHVVVPPRAAPVEQIELDIYQGD